MSPSRPLVLGARGQLGTELVDILGGDCGVAHGDVSIGDSVAVEALFAKRKPEVVYNCAAYNAVDRAESEPDAAMAANRDGPAVVAAACARHGARLVHYSTNFVFDGALDRPYLETDRPNPLSVYGASKRAGEEAVLAAAAGALVIRTAAVFGRVGTGFPDRVAERARREGAITMVADQRVNPTYARDLAERSIELVAHGESGIVHLVGGGCCAWDELAAAVLAALGIDAPITPVRGVDQPARRPRNGCLESVRVEPMRLWREALEEWAGAPSMRVT